MGSWGRLKEKYDLKIVAEDGGSKPRERRMHLKKILIIEGGDFG